MHPRRGSEEHGDYEGSRPIRTTPAPGAAGVSPCGRSAWGRNRPTGRSRPPKEHQCRSSTSVRSGSHSAALRPPKQRPAVQHTGNPAEGVANLGRSAEQPEARDVARASAVPIYSHRFLSTLIVVERLEPLAVVLVHALAFDLHRGGEFTLLLGQLTIEHGELLDLFNLGELLVRFVNDCL